MTDQVREVDLVERSSGDKGVERSETGGPAEPDGFDAATTLPRVLRLITSIVAPTTLLTALLFYFGVMYTVGYFQYFGVNYTVLTMPAQDYFISSASGLIIPLIYAAGVTLVALWLYQLRFDTMPAGARRIALRVLPTGTVLTGTFLVSLTIVEAVFQRPIFPGSFPEARGISLSLGVLLLAYAARLRRMLAMDRHPQRLRRRVPEVVLVARWGAVFILVSIGLFWAVGSYAAGAGTGKAHKFAEALPDRPSVLLYSEKSLSLQAPGVQEVTCQDPDAAYQFRYSGLRLVPQSGNHYLFLPANWTRTDGAAILIPRDAPVRLEFTLPCQVPDATC